MLEKFKKKVLPVFVNTMFIVGVFNEANLLIDVYVNKGIQAGDVMIINLIIIVISGLLIMAQAEE